MFGLIDRANKDTRFFCVMDNKRKENILPIIKKNVYTPDVNEENEDMMTRIFILIVFRFTKKMIS